MASLKGFEPLTSALEVLYSSIELQEYKMVGLCELLLKSYTDIHKVSSPSIFYVGREPRGRPTPLSLQVRR